MTVFGIKDPNAFRSHPFEVVSTAQGFVALRAKRDISDTFAELTARRAPMSVDDMTDALSGKTTSPLQLANVGISVMVSMNYDGKKYAVFTKRGTKTLAHICGYVTAGESFREAAIRAFHSEFIVARGDKFVMAVGKQPVFGTMLSRLDYYFPWKYQFVEQPQNFVWIPTAVSGSALSQAAWNFNQSIEGTDLTPSGAAIYFDPGHSCAQIAYAIEVDLGVLNMPNSLLHISDRFANGNLEATLGEPLVLIEIERHMLDEYLSDNAFNLIDGKLVPIDLKGYHFHEGVSPVNDRGVCLQPTLKFGEHSHVTMSGRDKFTLLNSLNRARNIFSNRSDLSFDLELLYKALRLSAQISRDFHASEPTWLEASEGEWSLFTGELRAAGFTSEDITTLRRI